MAEIPTSDWTRINEAADRFERAWKDGRGRGSRTTSPRPSRDAGRCSRSSSASRSSCAGGTARNRRGEYRRRSPSMPPVVDASSDERDRIACLLGRRRSTRPRHRARRPSTCPRSASVLARLAETIGSVPRVLLRDTERRARDPGGPAVVPRDARGDRPLPAPRRDRPRRHGRRPQGPRPRPGPRPGRQGPARGAPATTPSWSAGSSRRRRSAASSSTRASCRSTSWASSPTAGRTSP